MIYKATYSNDNGSLVQDKQIEELFAALGRVGYKTSSHGFDDTCGCVSFYSPAPIGNDDMVVKINCGEWTLKKVLD